MDTQGCPGLPSPDQRRTAAGAAPDQHRGGAMKAKAAVTRENARGMTITEYAVRDPGPEEVLIRVAMASLCGSDLHMWRGEVPWFQRAPGIQGHEMTGRAARLGAGRKTDSLGRPLRQ